MYACARLIRQSGVFFTLSTQAVNFALAFVSIAVCTPGRLRFLFVFIPFFPPVRQTTDRIGNQPHFFAFSRRIID